jgi:hypothetical protein
MFTKVSAFDEPKECYCLSTDTKPLDVPNGSFCVEMDTGKLYFYDGENAEWKEWTTA